MDLDFVSVHKHAKKEQGQYPAILTEQAWSIKDLLYGIKHHNMINVPSLHNRIPSEQDSSILPAQVANHNARFGSSCALAGRIINEIINLINNALWLPFYYSVIVTSYWLHQLKTGFNAN